MKSYIGSVMYLTAANNTNVPFVLFVYRDALVSVRPTWQTLNSIAGNGSIMGSVADLAFTILSLNGQGAALAPLGTLRLMRRIRALYNHFHERAARISYAELAAEIQREGWRVIVLLEHEIETWSHTSRQGSSGSRIEIVTICEKRYEFGGGTKALRDLAKLLSCLPSGSKHRPN
jgi:hypothetical protein